MEQTSSKGQEGEMERDVVEIGKCKGSPDERLACTLLDFAALIRKGDEFVPAVLADVMAKAAQRIEVLARLDREAATHVETVICTRTGFTGDEPYVGWRGLGLALTEALDERDRFKALLLAGIKAVDHLTKQFSPVFDGDEAGRSHQHIRGNIAAIMFHKDLGADLQRYRTEMKEDAATRAVEMNQL